MKKVSLITLFFVACASLFVSSAIAPSVQDFVYSVSPDVSVMSIQPGAGVRQYRYNSSTGKWQYQTTVGATWYDAPTTTLTDMLNYLNVATTADILSSSDLISVLKQYFSDNTTFEFDTVSGNSSLSFAKIMHSIWPDKTFSYSYRTDLSSSNSNTRVASSLPQLLSFIHESIANSNFASVGSYFLSENGIGYPTSVTQSYGRMTSIGIAGLGTLLGGGISGNGHSYLIDIIDGQNDILNDLMGNTSLSPEFYAVGGQGTDPGIPRSNLALYFADYLKQINRGVVSSGHDYLSYDGTLYANSDGMNYSLADITSDGFLGLASILRGYNGEAGSNGLFSIAYSRLNYSDMTKSDSAINSIVEALILPLMDIQNDLATYMYSHGTDLDIRERENMNPQAEQFVDDFTSSSGSGTPTTGQISDTAGVSGGIKNIFSGSSTPSDAFSQITNSDNYSFLSSQTQSELNPFYSSRSRSTDIVDFVSPKLNEIYSGVGSSW